MLALLRRWFVYRAFVPQAEAVTLMRQLPRLPESDRMRTREPELPKVRTIEDWKRRHA